MSSQPVAASRGLSMRQAMQNLKGMLGMYPAFDRGQKEFDRHQFDTVGEFLEKHSINPCPENYGLVFKFCVCKETELLPAIGELIKTGYAPDDNKLAAVTTNLEQDLDDLVNNTQSQLVAIEQVVAHTHSDASEYGTALEGASEGLADNGKIDAQAILALCDLTRTMISKTRAVETELRTRSKAIDGLVNSLNDAKHKADTDALTGLSNRRAFERQLGAAVERAKQTGVPCALAICDIDNFKDVNDRFGHQTGDRLIKLMADNLADHCGSHGHVFRFGGDEYVILFEGIASEKAFGCIESARQALEQRALVHLETKTPIGAMSFSGGISTMGLDDDPSELLGNADRALYQAKSQGRNCVRSVCG
ncbi:MAG: GGDEF domain-containing protein [Sphingorhabdus sp.]